MAKDTFYFPHDYNARNDRKVAALIQKHKAAGYGVFWITCEMMHEEDGSIEFDEITFGAIAKDSNELVEFVKLVIIDCITEFKLFKREEDIVLSGRVSRNLEHRREISKSRSDAGKRSAFVRQMSTNVQQNSTKERKGKENKGERFADDGLSVIFPDGSVQPLGENQKFLLERKQIKPSHIEKGYVD